MGKIFVNQVGFLPTEKKAAVLNFNAEKFSLCDETGKEVFESSVKHFGTDDISGEDAYLADFSEFSREGRFFVKAGEEKSCSFEIGKEPFDKLMKDLLKTFYYLRCGSGLDEKYAGVYAHKPCHTSLATVYGTDEKVDVTGGWHDAGDFGRYTTAGCVAVSHLLLAVRMFPEILKVEFNIPKCDKLPDILAEVKVELDFLMKMQSKDGGAWHKVTTFSHAPFVMPEDDKEELFLFAVSSIATADLAATCALAYTVYKDYDSKYADKLLDTALKAYGWLEENPQEVLFKNVKGSNTGEYGEAEDISNRFWAASALYEATGDKKYLNELLFQKERLLLFEEDNFSKRSNVNIFVCFGWEDVAGLGSAILVLKNEDNSFTDSVKSAFVKEADRLLDVALKNGFGLCMEAKDFIWGSNMELGKYLMILSIAKQISGSDKYNETIDKGFAYLLGCNSMDTSYVTGNGEKAYKNPHLRPTAVDNVEDPWPGLVSGGPNVGLQDERAKEVDPKSAPMKCYLDHIDCYSLNEITIYWNSPFVFALAGLLYR